MKDISHIYTIKMYVILVYDVNKKRVGKVLKICRKYLERVQNSVFEGQITEGKLEKLKRELTNVIKTYQDSVVIYKLNTTKFVFKDEIGVNKENSRII